MQVRNMVCAVLLSVLSVSAFGQGQSLKEREADLDRREAAVKEAELAQREAAVAEREKALKAQQAAQPAQAEAPKRNFLGRMLHPNESKSEQDASAPKKGGMTRIIGFKDGLLNQQEVVVVTLGQDYTTIRTDGGETWKCRTAAVRGINGDKAKVKDESLTDGNCTKDTATASAATVASNTATQTDYVSLRGTAAQTTTASAPASNGGTAVSVTLSRGGMIAMETGGVRKQWKCAPTQADLKRPGSGALVAWTDTWSAKDFTDRRCATYTGK